MPQTPRIDRAIAAWIDKGLRKPGKSNKDMAKALGIEGSRVSELRHGKRRAQASELSTISIYLEEPLPSVILEDSFGINLAAAVPILSWVSAGELATVDVSEDGSATYKRFQPNPMRFEPVSTNTQHKTLFPDNEPVIVGRVRKSIQEF